MGAGQRLPRLVPHVNAVAASAAGVAADGVSFAQGHAVGLEAAGFSGGSGVDDHFGRCAGLAAEEAPDGVSGAFEPEAHLGVDAHPVVADDVVASTPSAGVGGVLAVGVSVTRTGELALMIVEVLSRSLKLTPYRLQAIPGFTGPLRDGGCAMRAEAGQKRAACPGCELSSGSD